MGMTKVYLMNTPLDKDYQHTLYFDSIADQQAYFQKQIKSVYTYTNFSYQRKDNVIRVPKHVDILYAGGVNYCMYQNTEYTDKWFYAFVTDIKYVDDGRTDVYIKTDCVQTWMFDITVKPSFVEREHATTDNVGDHTIDEGMELGEYKCNMHSVSGYAGDNMAIVLGVTKTSDGKNVTGVLYNNIYSGVRYYSFDASKAQTVNAFLEGYDSDGAGEAIACMFLAPTTLAPLAPDNGNMVPGTPLTKDYYINPATASSNGITKTLTTGRVDEYAPRNKKLLTFPYRYLLVSNNAGMSVPFRYEFFRDFNGAAIEPRFLIEGVLTPGCSIRMVPIYYAGAYRNDEHGINMGKFPILNWTSDVYTNWLTQNGVNIALQVASGVGQIVGGAAMMAATGGLGAAVGGGQIVGGLSSIAGTMAQVHQQSFTPPQSKGNLNSGDVVTATDQNDFHFYDMSIRAEYAKAIDEFFDMYGYKCHRVKVPAKNHRENYWFTKTIDANITGKVPQDDLQTVKDCYNRGITFWKNETYFRNYKAPNGIV